jgi:hypothetical protein
MCLLLVHERGVQFAKRKRGPIDGRPICSPLQLRATTSAKGSCRGWRRTISTNEFRAFGKAKVALRNSTVGRECSAVRLVAHAAMAMRNAFDIARYLVTNSSTKTASVVHKMAKVSWAERKDNRNTVTYVRSQGVGGTHARPCCSSTDLTRAASSPAGALREIPIDMWPSFVSMIS